MPSTPDRLRYLPGRSRNKAHLIPAWQDHEAFQTSRCGITDTSNNWWGGSDDAEIITAYKRKRCGNCAKVFRINEGHEYVAPFYPEGKSA